MAQDNLASKEWRDTDALSFNADAQGSGNADSTESSPQGETENVDAPTQGLPELGVADDEEGQMDEMAKGPVEDVPGNLDGSTSEGGAEQELPVGERAHPSWE